MGPNVLAYVVGAAVVVVLAIGLLNLVESRRTRRMVESLLAPKRGRGRLGKTMFFEREPVIVAGRPRLPSVVPDCSRPPSVAPAAGAPASSESAPPAGG